MIVTSLFVFGSWKFQINEWESYLITRNQGPKAGWSLWPRRRPCSQSSGRVNGLDRPSSAHFAEKNLQPLAKSTRSSASSLRYLCEKALIFYQNQHAVQHSCLEKIAKKM